jgi:hypothetical protein
MSCLKFGVTRRKRNLLLAAILISLPLFLIRFVYGVFHSSHFQMIYRGYFGDTILRRTIGHKVVEVRAYTNFAFFSGDSSTRILQILSDGTVIDSYEDRHLTYRESQNGRFVTLYTSINRGTVIPCTTLDMKSGTIYRDRFSNRKRPDLIHIYTEDGTNYAIKGSRETQNVSVQRSGSENGTAPLMQETHQRRKAYPN